MMHQQLLEDALRAEIIRLSQADNPDAPYIRLDSTDDRLIFVDGYLDLRALAKAIGAVSDAPRTIA